MPWDFALILFLLAAVVPWRGAVRIKKLFARAQVNTADRLALYASTIAFQWIAVAMVVWRATAHGIPPRHLGVAIPDAALTGAAALSLSLLLAANQYYGLHRISRLPPARQTFLHQMARHLMPHTLVEALGFVALAATVALCEEFLYRGFAFAVLLDATRGSVLLGVAGSSALFALAHIYQGRRGLVSTFIAGTLFAAARVLTGSIAPSIAAHFVADLVAGLGARRFLLSGEAQPQASGDSPAGSAAERDQP